MYQKQQHSNFIKSIVVMFLIMFSLAPCSVKEVALNSVSIDYTKPSSRSFSLSQNTDCKVLSALESAAITNAKASYKHHPQAVVYTRNSAASPTLTISTDAAIGTSFSQAILTNYSAKYILYKRLKLGMA
ncbi:MAG TPA: hypothetical protein VLZ11_02330 [Flavobacterium sp.]|nr:hypothetical protein [Flavobacterium sp.]